ncbi:MAG TPA: trypsin-like peptidase domain-containing protein [Rhodothermales bacterium]|nr:trypsin-like peptidase domain-containing protein [Rhodothermales bacterium]
MKLHALVLFLLYPILSSLYVAGIIRHDRHDDTYRQLAQQPQFVSVFPLESEGAFIGSSVLIAPSWLLTAEHVVRAHSAHYLEVATSQHRYAVDAIIKHPEADLALVHLAEPIPSVQPAIRYRAEDEQGRRGVSVGYGVSGTGDETMGILLERGREYVGIKRAGENIIDEINSGSILQADFDHPMDSLYNMMGSPEALDLEYFPYRGDSGGGLFIEVEDGWRLCGITIEATTPRRVVSGDGNPKNAKAYGWISQWHRVSDFNAWIDRHIQ